MAVKITTEQARAAVFAFQACTHITPEHAKGYYRELVDAFEAAIARADAEEDDQPTG